MKQKLPIPECKYGYTERQIDKIMGKRRAEFEEWMRGQTMTLCNGVSFNHETQHYEISEHGNSHGAITYERDVERFLYHNINKVKLR